MTRVHVTGGYLNVESRGEFEGPVDPGFGVGGDSIDNSLPSGVPPIGSTLPEPPPGIWPPPNWYRPIQPLPPDSTVPPGTIWPPPGRPDRPDNSLPSGGRPDNTLPSGKFWIVAGIPGVGWRYVCVDPSLTPGMPLPPTPTPAPKAA